ncbi:MAG: SoxR reducing system RseC family protein [Deltaproteobacteria bacterium]|nr:SoxR reducing system RseC family protein [Candidatus Anaeroferrophillacea bacterium]
MTRHTGIVEEISGTDALVRIAGGGGACRHCPSRSTCLPLAGGSEVSLRVKNRLDARPGDRVTVGNHAPGEQARAMLITAAVVILFLIGGAAGRRLIDRLGTDPLGGHLPLLAALLPAVAAGLLLHRRFRRQAGELVMFEVQRQSPAEDGHDG